MKKRMSVVLSMALVMGIMGQCAIAVNAASKTDDDTLNITLINQGSGQPYIAAYKNCFEKAEKDLNIKVNLVDGGWDANQQANAIQNAISSGADGIVISPVDPSAVCTYVDEALDAGIEVCALTTQIGTGDAAVDQRADRPHQPGKLVPAGARRPFLSGAGREFFRCLASRRTADDGRYYHGMADVGARSRDPARVAGSRYPIGHHAQALPA